MTRRGVARRKLGFGQLSCRGLSKDSNLVDSASSHTLVSKIKPCMSKYKRFILWNCEWLIISVIVYLIVPYYLDTRSNSRANTCIKPQLLDGAYLLDGNQSLCVLWWIMITVRIAWPCAGDGSFKFLPYQLWMVGYWPTMAVTGNGELGFDSGEGAWETATTSKEGSRRVNYPILTQGGSDNK